LELKVGILLNFDFYIQKSNKFLKICINLYKPALCKKAFNSFVKAKNTEYDF